MRNAQVVCEEPHKFLNFGRRIGWNRAGEDTPPQPLNLPAVLIAQLRCPKRVPILCCQVYQRARLNHTRGATILLDFAGNNLDALGTSPVHVALDRCGDSRATHPPRATLERAYPRPHVVQAKSEVG